MFLNIDFFLKTFFRSIPKNFLVLARCPSTAASHHGEPAVRVGPAPLPPVLDGHLPLPLTGCIREALARSSCQPDSHANSFIQWSAPPPPPLIFSPSGKSLRFFSTCPSYLFPSLIILSRIGPFLQSSFNLNSALIFFPLYLPSPPFSVSMDLLYRMRQISRGGGGGGKGYYA